MLEFTSALYLGISHAGSTVPWRSLTTGVPAALQVPEEARDLERRLAVLVGTEQAVVGPSTLHLFFDLIPLMAKGRLFPPAAHRQRSVGRPMSIHLDRAAYPIARWGAERAAHRGAPMTTFRHHDPTALERQLRRSGRGHRPLVVIDGVCPGCGALAPLEELLEVTRRFDGALLVDDTQALGVLGAQPGPSAPLGWGGGGSLSCHQLDGPDVVVVSSLAKGFGVPIAMLGGGTDLISGFEGASETRIHSSPPSLCHLYAAEAALDANQHRGDRLRARLVSLIARLQAAVARLGLSTTGGPHPVQMLDPAPGLDPVRLHGRLLALGVRTVLAAPRCGGEPRVSLLITAAHRPVDIDRAVAALAGALRAAA